MWVVPNHLPVFPTSRPADWVSDAVTSDERLQLGGFS